MDATAEPDLLHYSDFRLYLADFHRWRKQGDPGFSLRRFAKEIGFSSHTLLRYILDGQRNLSKRTLVKVSLALGLSGPRADFFENLVFFNQAASMPEKDHFYQKLLAADKTRGMKKLEARQFEVLKTWYHTAIREMLNLGSFNPDPAWIARTLLPPIEPKDARDSLKLLTGSGLIKRTANGYVAVNDAITTDDETLALFVRNYHLEMLDLAKRALDAVPPDQRDISSVCMTIREADLPKLKKQIQLMRKELRVFAAEGRQAERVVQVNIQLFPLSQGNQGNLGSQGKPVNPGSRGV
jgi:uncharacterized protein (TIGR02147 family)